jgi:hypothetical protein
VGRIRGGGGNAHDADGIAIASAVRFSFRPGPYQAAFRRRRPARTVRIPEYAGLPIFTSQSVVRFRGYFTLRKASRNAFGSTPTV